jgi:hypothetical protein
LAYAFDVLVQVGVHRDRVAEGVEADALGDDDGVGLDRLHLSLDSFEEFHRPE